MSARERETVRDMLDFARPWNRSNYFSGILFAYGLAKKDGIGHVLRYNAHRLIKTLPMYYLLLWFLICCFARMGEGPTWDIESQRYLKNCGRTWWANIALINNFFKVQDQVGKRRGSSPLSPIWQLFAHKHTYTHTHKPIMEQRRWSPGGLSPFIVPHSFSSSATIGLIDELSIYVAVYAAHLADRFHGAGPSGCDYREMLLQNVSLV